MKTQVDFEDYMPDYSKIADKIQHNFQQQNEQTNRMLDEISTERENRYNDKVNREKRMIELLESIDKNTSTLTNVMKLLEENTKDQKAILDILSEFNSLATIPEREKKESMFRTIMNKINTTISDVNTVTTLYSYGLFIYNLLHSLGKI